MRRIYHGYVWMLIVISVIGCAQLGLPVAQTFNQKLTAAVSTVEAMMDTTTNLLNMKKISSDDAQHIQDQLRNALAGLDIARNMATSDKTSADLKLTSIHTALVALQAYITSKGG